MCRAAGHSFHFILPNDLPLSLVLVLVVLVVVVLLVLCQTLSIFCFVSSRSSKNQFRPDWRQKGRCLLVWSVVLSLILILTPASKTTNIISHNLMFNVLFWPRWGPSLWFDLILSSRNNTKHMHFEACKLNCIFVFGRRLEAARGRHCRR